MQIRQLAYFVAAGAANTAICYLLYVSFLRVHLSPGQSLLFAYIIASVIGFFLMGRLVFDSKLKAHKYLRYVIMHVTGYLMNLGIVSALISLSVQAEIAGLLSLVMVASFSFITSKTLVFLRD